MAPTLQQFKHLLANLTPETILELLTMSIPYSQKMGTNSKEVDDFVAVFIDILNAVLQLQVCPVCEGITRNDARQFVALFNGHLTPTFDASTVRTNTVGEEILRILNHMPFSMQTWK
jgi:hypothetical protein